MSAKAKDETGNRYGRLLVLSRSYERKSDHARWDCKCECGNTTTVEGSNLRSGVTASCGCLMRSRVVDANTTHGMTGRSELNIFMGMNARCLCKTGKDYARYGGRGITVCDRWNRNSPDAFQNFLADMGELPSSKHSLDRRDNDSGYSPDNCRWATPKEQQNNKRTNRHLVYKGVTKNVTQWSEELGIDKALIFSRLRLGWTTAQALATERKSNTSDITYLGRTQTPIQWSREFGISTNAIRKRIRLGWSLERVFSTRVQTATLQLTHAGRTQTFANWGREVGIKSGTLRYRLKAGWTTAQALGFEKR